MLGLRHRFLTARHDDAGVAIGDLLHAKRDCAQAGAAQLIEVPGCLFLRHARLHGGLPGRILALSCRQNLPQNHLVHLGWIDVGALQSAFHRSRAKIVGGRVCKSSVERADRCARCADDDDFAGHACLSQIAGGFQIGDIFMS